jgi:gluconate kinase
MDSVASNELAAGVRLTDEQRLDWLRLIRSDNIGPRGLRAQLHQTPDSCCHSLNRGKTMAPMTCQGSKP